MKKILPIIIGIVLIAGGAYYFLSKKGGGLTSVGNVQKFATLKAAVELGVPLKCTYKVEDIEYEGYIKGEKWRGKVKSADGKVGEVIMKDSCMWSWTEDDKQGVKTCFETTEVDEGDSVWEQSEAATDVDMEYNCMPTAVTDAKFNPPSDVNFMDLDAMMQGFGQ